MSLRLQQSRTEAGEKSYKTGFDGDDDDARRRRDAKILAIWQKKREERLLKKQRKKQLASIPLMVQAIWSDDPLLQYEATTEFAKLLTIESSPPIDEVINAGVIPRFVEFLGRNYEHRLQFEASCALAHVLSGTSEHIKAVIEYRAIPMFVEHLSSGRDFVREQAIWVLGKIASHSPSCRDLVLDHGALVELLWQLNEHSRRSMLRKAAQTLSLFCHGKPPPPFERVKPALPVLNRLLHSRDEQIIEDVCWALSYLSDGSNEKKQAVIEAGVCRRLVHLLLFCFSPLTRYPSPAVILPALLTLGNIVSGDDSQTQCIIDNQVLASLYQLLTRPYIKSIKKEVCWIVANITAGNQAQIQAVIDANIILPLVHLLQTAEFDVKKEAAWSISNAISGGSHKQIRLLARQGCIKPLCDLLTCPDPLIVDKCLDALLNILKVGEAVKESGLTNGANPYVFIIDECEGVDKIESLQTHENHDIYEKALNLLDSYFTEADDEEETVRNITQNGFRFVVPNGGFKFGQVLNRTFELYGAGRPGVRGFQELHSVH